MYRTTDEEQKKHKIEKKTVKIYWKTESDWIDTIRMKSLQWKRIEWRKLKIFVSSEQYQKSLMLKLK